MDYNPPIITKQSLGLGSVDNTPDIEKPISQATLAALNALQSSIGNHEVTLADLAKAIDNEASARALEIEAKISAEQSARVAAIGAETQARIRALLAEAQARANAISSGIAAVNATITEEKRTREAADVAETMARQTAVSELSDSLSTTVAALTAEQTTRATADAAETLARTTAVSALQTALDTTNATLTTEQSTRATADTANATAITTLSAQVNDATTGLPATRSTVSTLASAYLSGGQAVATWGFKLDAGGKVVKMQAIAASGGTQAETGTIVFGGADLQSDNYVAGSAGWKLRYTGDVEFNNAVFRGTVYASAGTIGGFSLSAHAFTAGSGVDRFVISSDPGATGIRLGSSGTVGTDVYCTTTGSGVLLYDGSNNTIGNLMIDSDGSTSLGLGGGLSFLTQGVHLFGKTSKISFGGGASEDTFLYRSAANTLKTDGALVIAGALTSSKGGVWCTATGSTTGTTYLENQNTGARMRLGLESSTGGAIVSGGSAYAVVLNSVNNTPVQIGVNNSVVGTFSSSGLAVTGGLSASNGVSITGGSFAQGSIYVSPSLGMVIAGKAGSTNGMTLTDAAGNVVMNWAPTASSVNMSVGLGVAGNGSFSTASTNSTLLNLTNTVTGGRVWTLYSSGGGPASAGVFGIYDSSGGGNRLTIDATGLTSLYAGLSVAGAVSTAMASSNYLTISSTSSQDAAVKASTAGGTDVYFGVLPASGGAASAFSVYIAGEKLRVSSTGLTVTGSGSFSTGLSVGGNAVIHAGNIGSQSVNYATTAGSASTATTATSATTASRAGTANLADIASAVAWSGVGAKPTASAIANIGTSYTASGTYSSDVGGIQSLFASHGNAINNILAALRTFGIINT